MKENKYLRETLLAVVMCTFFAFCIVLRTFLPLIILPKFNIPTITAISLITALLDHFLTGKNRKTEAFTFVFSVGAFGILPYVSGYISSLDIIKTALSGGIVYTVISFIFSEIQDRMSVEEVSISAFLITAFGIFLAFQSFTGIIL